MSQCVCRKPHGSPRIDFTFRRSFPSAPPSHVRVERYVRACMVESPGRVPMSPSQSTAPTGRGENRAKTVPKPGGERGAGWPVVRGPAAPGSPQLGSGALNAPRGTRRAPTHVAADGVPSGWPGGGKNFKNPGELGQPNTGPTLIVTLLLSLALWAGIWGQSHL